MKFIDYYAVLGVPRTASQEEIQQAYRKLARENHPDVTKEPAATQKFKEAGEAYEVLKDPEKRKKYDQYGEQWKTAGQTGGMPPGWENIDFGGGGPGGFSFGSGDGFSSFFEMLFGMGAQGGRRPGGRGMRGSDVEGVLNLSLEEAANGGRREVGLADARTGQTRNLDVRIPEAILPGQKIRLAGQGAPGPGGGPPGDVYLRVEILPHADFRLDGRDLHALLLVTPWEAALGAEVRVKTLDGEVTMKVPRGSSSGRRIRLRGKGFKNPKGAPGDLYAEIRIVVPEELTSAEDEIFRKLGEISQFAPRDR